MRYVERAGVDPEQIAAAISLDVHAYDVPLALEMMQGSVVEQNSGIIRHLFGDTEEAQLMGSPIHYTGGWAAPALVVSVDEDPSVEGSYGYLVSRAAEHYVDALTVAGHHAVAFHDRNESHASLVGGFGETGDAVTEAIASFLEAHSEQPPPAVPESKTSAPGRSP